MKTIISILGGDKRSIFLKDILENDKINTKLYGFGDAENFCDVLKESKYIVLPMPFSKDDVHIFAPYSNKSIKIKDILQIISQNQIVFCGNLSNSIKKLFDSYNIHYIDICQKKDFAILNAIPTAEGALKIAIENTNFTIHQSNCMVIGYGNIGKILAKYLKDLQSNVHVVCRSSFEMSTLYANNFIPVNICEISEFLPNIDLIFNTVPSVIIKEKNIFNLKPDVTYIELASKPFGIDLDLAELYKVNVILAGSLPGSIAPKTAASYIKKIIYAEMNPL